MDSKIIRRMNTQLRLARRHGYVSLIEHRVNGARRYTMPGSTFERGQRTADRRSPLTAYYAA